MRPFGKLLIIDCFNCKGNINDKRVIQTLIDDMVETMEMKKVGDTHFEWFDMTPFNVENDLVGYSVSQIISMSSITLHICSLSKRVYLDCFTCCEVNDELINKINNLITWAFTPETVEKKIINRH